MIKRFLSGLLCLALLTGFSTAAAFASENDDYIDSVQNNLLDVDAKCTAAAQQAVSGTYRLAEILNLIAV